MSFPKWPVEIKIFLSGAVTINMDGEDIATFAECDTHDQQRAYAFLSGMCAGQGRQCPDSFDEFHIHFEFEKIGLEAVLERG